VLLTDLVGLVKATAAQILTACRTAVKPVGAVRDVLKLAGGVKKAPSVAAAAGLLIGAVRAVSPLRCPDSHSFWRPVRRAA